LRGPPLFQAFVACNIAKDTIPDLPAEIARVVEEPLQPGSAKFRPDLTDPS
jgi:hypothetical protein